MAVRWINPPRFFDPLTHYRLLHPSIYNGCEELLQRTDI
jgi:hypothetical protein